MKIAVLSDTHDNIWNLEKVINYLQGKVEAVIFLGDFCAPFMALYLSQLAVPVYACLGNNDEDQVGLVKKGGANFNWTALAEEFGQIELAGRKIAFCHYPKLAQLLAETGDYDAVFHGHTHNPYQEYKNGTLLANPGAVCGIQNGRQGKASFGIYDPDSNSIEIIDITQI